MKKIVSVLLVIVISVSVLTACSADKPKKKPQKASTGNHTLYFRDKSKSEKVTATFFNSANEKKTTVKMVKIDEDKDSRTFSCKGDTTAYNMAYITYDGMRTSKFAFNKCVSGWNNDEKGFMPYVYGENPTYKYKYKDVTLKFIGYDKIIHIWTPEGYDASSKEKYSTLYLLDGHAVDFIEQPIGHTVAESDNATEQVKSMMKLTGNKVIQVAVETDGDTVDNTRDDELIPNLGKMAHEEGTSKKNGSKFADFMNDTVVPYIQKHYNLIKCIRELFDVVLLVIGKIIILFLYTVCALARISANCIKGSVRLFCHCLQLFIREHFIQSRIVSKGISAGRSQNSYRGLVKVLPGADGARNHSQCDSLLLGDKCGAHTFPVIESDNPGATIEHEATTSKISEEQLFYCRQRGITEEDAIGLIVNGYAKEVLGKLPMEFAVEAQKLLQVSLEGSIG